jgi:hypothetical protein
MTMYSQPQQPDESFSEYMARLQEEQMQFMMAKQQGQPSGGQSSSPPMSMISELAGGGGAGAGGVSGSMGMGSDAASLAAAESGAGGSAASTPYGALAALIAAIGYGQSKSTGANDRVIEGQKTGDWFSGGSLGDRSPMTEPWFAALSNKLDLSPTAGEKFDAAWRNDDTGTWMKRLPAAADYWADPIRSWLGLGGEYLGDKIAGKQGGKVGSAIFNPIGKVLGLFD